MFEASPRMTRMQHFVLSSQVRWLFFKIHSSIIIFTMHNANVCLLSEKERERERVFHHFCFHICI
jgi:hypothetical protein